MRLTRLLAVVMTAALLSAALATQVAEANQRWSGSQPSVGQCRKLTHLLDRGPRQQHHLPDLVQAGPQLPRDRRTPAPQGRDLERPLDRHQAPRTWRSASATRRSRQRSARTTRVRDRTAYTWFYFVPTKSQRAAHQRWFRCDLGLQHATQYAVLPTDRVPALSDATPSNNVARCLRLVNGHYLTTSCSTAHAYRSAGTFGVAKKSYPGVTALLQQGRSRCPRIVATDTNFRWTWNSQPIWNRGHNHIVVCYSTRPGDRALAAPGRFVGQVCVRSYPRVHGDRRGRRRVDRARGAELRDREGPVADLAGRPRTVRGPPGRTGSTPAGASPSSPGGPSPAGCRCRAAGPAPRAGRGGTTPGRPQWGGGARAGSGR